MSSTKSVLRRKLFGTLDLCRLEDRLTPAFNEFLDPNPVVSNAFGNSVVPLANGNVVITSPNDDFGGSNVGAVYLYNGSTGKLISTLRGSTANDTIGGGIGGGIVPLPSGNFLVHSPNWDNGSAADAGAVTFVNGVTGLNGTISAANSLVGSSNNDKIGNGALNITVLSNGNYIVRTISFDFLGVTDSGSVTWGSGTKGVSGAVSASNSLVCTVANTQIGNAFIQELANGNYIVRTSSWDNGTAIDAGAVTWGSGTQGVSGIISSAISLVGSTTLDNVGGTICTLLPNGDYIVVTGNWDFIGGPVDVGAVTLCDGSSGRVGTVSAANSLVGSTANDQVGVTGITVLPNGNFLVRSSIWDNGAVANAGAVTFVNGAADLVGSVSAANSLVGSTASDSVGANTPILLANGNYVIRTPLWDNPGVATNAGAITWGSGAIGVSGAIAGANSLAGTGTGEQSGSGGVIALPNGNYVVLTPLWNSKTVGAVTWCNGLSGRVGALNAGNSLFGSTAGDQVGSGGITVLPNSNYVVRSPLWDNGAATNAGAVTWVNGTTGLVGAVSTANSLVGNAVNDQLGTGSTVALANGNYVVVDPFFDNGITTDVGSVTWGNGASGAPTGPITLANTLIGSSANDGIGINVTPLPNGNYVMTSPNWDNGAAVDAGAVTWGNGTGGTVGQINSGNSLVGATSSDVIGNNGIVVLSNSNYVFRSQNWDNGGIANTGAVTWGNGATVTSGVIGTANSLVGSHTNDDIGNTGIVPLPNGHYVVCSPTWDNGSIADTGAVTWGNGTIGAKGAISSANSLVGTATNDTVGGTVTGLGNGNYIVQSVNWNNGASTTAGAVTFGNGTTGVSGNVSAVNSLVGSTTNDSVGLNVFVLANGDYLVASKLWNYGTLADSGAMTWGSGSTGVSSVISPINSVLGLAGTAGLNATPVLDDVNDTFIARFTIETFGGKVRIGSQSSGVIPTLSTAYVDDGFAALTPGTTIADADSGTAGSQPARYGENAFTNLPDALAHLADGGTLVLNTGTYPENVAMTRDFTWKCTSGTVIVAGVVSGPISLHKTGVGQLSLAATNTYIGDTIVDQGDLKITTDASLGAATGTVTLSSLATLSVASTATTARIIDLKGGTLIVNGTLTLAGARVSGGSIYGGTVNTAPAMSSLIFNDEIFAFTTFNSLGNDSFQNVRNHGAFTTAAGTTYSLDSFTNESNGRATLNGTGNVNQSAFNGQNTVNGVVNAGSLGPLVFGGGSVTAIAAGAAINLGATGAYLAGGLVNNMGNFGGAGATITVDFNGLVKGTGTFGSIVTQNGGVFAPGASPGTATTNQLNLNGRGRLEFEVTNAGGTPGVVSGWDLVNVQPTNFSATGLMNYTSTPTDKYTILLKSRVDDGIGNTAGNAANFNTALSYAWKFADGSNANTTSSGSFNAANFSIDTSGFSNSFTGGFGVELRDGGKNLYVVYTPVAGPFVNGIVVNDGNAQRSRITKIAVNFAIPIDVATLQAVGAITLTRTAAPPGGIVGTVVNSGNGLQIAPASGLVSSVTLTFVNINTTGIDFGSLDDGRWQLAIPSAGFASPLNDPTLRRLFGDENNDGTVNAGDFAQFGNFFGATVSNNLFDFDTNGTINATDFAEFGNRFGVTL